MSGSYLTYWGSRGRLLAETEATPDAAPDPDLDLDDTALTLDDPGIREALARCRFLEIDRASPTQKARAGCVAPGTIDAVDFAAADIHRDPDIRFDVRVDTLNLSPTQVRLEAERLGREYLAQTKRDVLGGTLDPNEFKAFESDATRALRARAVAATALVPVEWDQAAHVVRVLGTNARAVEVAHQVLGNFGLALVPAWLTTAPLAGLSLDARDGARDQVHDAIREATEADFAGVLEEPRGLHTAALRRELLTWLVWRGESGEPLNAEGWDVDGVGAVIGHAVKELTLCRTGSVDGSVAESLTVAAHRPAQTADVARALRRGLLVDEIRLHLSVGAREYTLTWDGTAKRAGVKLPTELKPEDGDAYEEDCRMLREELDAAFVSIERYFAAVRFDAARWGVQAAEVSTWIREEVRRHQEEEIAAEQGRLMRQLDRMGGRVVSEGVETVQ